MDPSIVNPWVTMIAAVIAVAMTIYNLVSKPGEKALAKVADVEARLVKVEADLGGVHRDLEHMPDKDATHRMELLIGELKGELGIMAERLKPVSAIADRLQEFLLEQAKEAKK